MSNEYVDRPIGDKSQIQDYIDDIYALLLNSFRNGTFIIDNGRCEWKLLVKELCMSLSPFKLE